MIFHTHSPGPLGQPLAAILSFNPNGSLIVKYTIAHARTTSDLKAHSFLKARSIRGVARTCILQRGHKQVRASPRIEPAFINECAFRSEVVRACAIVYLTMRDPLGLKLSQRCKMAANGCLMWLMGGYGKTLTVAKWLNQS